MCGTLRQPSTNHRLCATPLSAIERIDARPSTLTPICWGVEIGQQLAHLGGHPQFALGVAFSPDGTQAASVGKKGLFCFWNVHTEEQAHVLKAPAPYEGMNVTGISGISEVQWAALKALGAVDR